jgi:FAD synthetase
MNPLKKFIFFKQKQVMVFGTFDILHKGHFNFFKQARKYGDLIVVIARDNNVKKIKGQLPKNNELIRLKNVQKYTPKVILGGKVDKLKVIKKIKPDIICVGYDQIVPINDLNLVGIPVKFLKPYKHHKYKSSKLS